MQQSKKNVNNTKVKLDKKDWILIIFISVFVPLLSLIGIDENFIPSVISATIFFFFIVYTFFISFKKQGILEEKYPQIYKLLILFFALIFIMEFDLLDPIVKVLIDEEYYASLTKEKIVLLIIFGFVLEQLRKGLKKIIKLIKK